MVNVSTNDPAAGTVLGSGARSYGDHAGLIAKASQGYDFVGWYSNNVLVSTDAEYSFKVTSDIDVVARFDPSV